MPVAKAPDDFLRGVQNRIRRRTRGRWYGIQAGRLRFPFEAAFNVLLIGILFSIYLSAQPAAEHPVPVAPTVDRATAVRDLLAPLGPVTVAADAEVAGAVTAALTLEAAKLPALHALVAARPELTLVGEPTAAPDGRLNAALRWTPAGDRAPPR
jgi:hypothetical protein